MDNASSYLVFILAIGHLPSLLKADCSKDVYGDIKYCMTGTIPKTYAQLVEDCTHRNGIPFFPETKEELNFVKDDFSHLACNATRLWVGARMVDGKLVSSSGADVLTLPFLTWKTDPSTIDLAAGLMTMNLNGEIFADEHIDNGVAICEVIHEEVAVNRQRRAYQCPSGWQSHGSSCHKLVPSSSSFNSAINGCKMFGSSAHLLDCETEDECSAAQSVVGWGEAWIGLQYKSSSGWQWVTGRTEDFSGFTVTFDTSRTTDTCVKISRTSLMTLYPCAMAKYYICEQPASGAALQVGSGQVRLSAHKSIIYPVVFGSILLALTRNPIN